jgi:hypothetical protein
VAVSGAPTPTTSGRRRKHSIIGWVLLAASLALFGLAAFHLVRMFSNGYDYACTGGDGCTYNAPDISGDMSWISVGIPIAIVLLVLSIFAFTFHRIRSAVGSAFGGAMGSAFGGAGSWGTAAFVLPLIARALTAASSRMGAGNPAWSRMVWPGMSTPGGPASGLPPGTAVPGGMFQQPSGSLPPGTTPVAAAGTATPPPVVLPPGTVTVTPMAGAGLPPAAAPDASQSETIQAAGLAAEAVITAMHDVGMANGTTRMYELDLAVTVPGSPTYHVKHVAWVPLAHVGRLYAGERLHAKVDPTDQNSMFLDLDT